MGNPDDPQLTVLVTLDRIPVELSLLNDTRTVVRTADKNGTLRRFEHDVSFVTALRQGPCKGPNLGIGRRGFRR